MKDRPPKKRAKEDNYFKKLQEKSLERLLELSGKIWTDHNIHDPGVTITDYLNYGLYDLHYRLSFPFENYLTNEKKLDCRAKGLLSREELFVRMSPSGNHTPYLRKSIVTEEDYEELILNAYIAQIGKCAVRLNLKSLKYDIFIKPKHSNLSAEMLKKLEKDIGSFYHKYRNIGETLGRVSFDWDNLKNKSLYSPRRYTKDVTYIFPEFEKPIDRTSNVQPFVADYHSIQYDFPENYGIGHRGIPIRENPSYRVKVLQLKAYLLIFDVLMAEQLRMAKNTSALFGLNEDPPARTLPHVVVTEGEHIVEQLKKHEVDLEIDRSHFYDIQRFRYLNMLDTLYGEDTRVLFGKTGISRLNEERAKFIQKIPFINEDRFRSFNIQHMNSSATLQHIFEDVFGAYVKDNRLFAKSIKIMHDEAFFSRYKFLINVYTEYLDDPDMLEDVPFGKSKYDEKHFYKILRLNFHLIWNGVLFDSLLKYGTDLSHYKILKYSDEYVLLFFHPEKEIVVTMSLFFSEKERLIELTYLFRDFIKKNMRYNQMNFFYLIEHILLGDVSSGTENHISIVLSDKVPAEEAENLLRERLPVHIRAHIYYLVEPLLKNFHILYVDWRRTLAAGHTMSKYASGIRSFLARNSAHMRPI